MPGLSADASEISTTTGSGRSTFFNFLKIDYFPELDGFLHVGTEIPTWVAQQKGKMGGQKAVAVAATKFPPAGVGRFEGHDMPTPRGTTGINPEIIARSMFYRLRWTMEVETAARKGNAVAWRNPMETDMEMAREQFEQTFARKLSNGPYDVIAAIASIGTLASGAGTFTVKAENSRTSGAKEFFDTGAAFLKENMSLAFVSDALTYGGNARNVHTGATANETYITAVDNSDPTAPVITMALSSSAWTGADPDVDDLVVAYAERQDAAAALYTSTQTAGGTATIPNDGTYQGLNGLDNVCTSNNGPYAALMGYAKSTNPGLNGYYNYNSAGTRQYSERFVDLCARQTRIRSGSLTKKVVCSPASLSEHARENRGDRLFQPVITESGYGKLTYNMGGHMIPIEEDWLLKNGIYYGIDPAFFGYFEERPLGPVDREYQYRFVNNKAASEVVACKRGNIEHRRPFAQWAVDDCIFDTNGITP